MPRALNKPPGVHYLALKVSTASEHLTHIQTEPLKGEEVWVCMGPVPPAGSPGSAEPRGSPRSGRLAGWGKQASLPLRCSSDGGCFWPFQLPCSVSEEHSSSACAQDTLSPASPQSKHWRSEGAAALAGGASHATCCNVVPALQPKAPSLMSPKGLYKQSGNFVSGEQLTISSEFCVLRPSFHLESRG